MIGTGLGSLGESEACCWRDGAGSDLTGFCGRCDALFFSREDTAPPVTVNETSCALRRRLCGLPAEPVDQEHFDAVVTGGGVAGTAAALAATRLGEPVALVQGDLMHHGNTVFFRTRMVDSASHSPPSLGRRWSQGFRRPALPAEETRVENDPGPLVIPPGHIPTHPSADA